MRNVVGNAQAQATLERALASGQLRQAYLLHGPAGVGKFTLAQALAQAALCQRGQPGETEACGECAACRKVAHGNHPDLILIEPTEDRRWIAIKDVRQALQLANRAPSESAYRMVIIPDADRLREDGANALLKMLEEPPEGVIFLLLSTDADTVLPTILSRCQLVALRPLGFEEVSRALHERWGVAPEAAARLAGLANGRLGWAVRAHERPEEQAERERLLERIVALVAAPADERLRSVAAIGSDNASARAALDVWIGWWRDVTLAANGAHALASVGAARGEAERVGAAIGPEPARAYLAQLLAALASMDVNANPRLTLENLALALPHLRPVGARH